MILSHFRVGLRSLAKNRVFSLINIIGLAVGMAAFMLIVQYVRYERSYEDFNEKAANVWRVTLDLYNGSQYLSTDCETHALLGPTVKEKMPEVDEFVRMFKMDGQQEIHIGDRKFTDDGLYFADSTVFNVFSIKVLEGDPRKALRDPMHAVITESIAQKFFGRNRDVVGSSMLIEGEMYNVSAVIRDVPANTHLKYSILVSHTTLNRQPNYNQMEWMGNNEYTYLLMKPGADLNDFNSKLSSFCASIKEKLNNACYQAQPIKDIHLYSNKTFEPEINGSAKVLNIVMVIGVFIILIACMNYVNLATARAINRAREVGIKKVMGSLRGQLVAQFLSESMLVNLFSGMLALLLFYFALPFLRHLTAQPLPLRLSSDIWFWYLLIALVGVVTLLAGFYPAIVLSSFKPAAVLKGKFQSSGHGQSLRKGLVVFQFGASITLAICLLAAFSQISYLRSYELGINTSQALVIRVPRLFEVPDSLFESTYRIGIQRLRNELLQQQAVAQVAGSQFVPGLSLNETASTYFTRKGEDDKGKKYYYTFFAIDENYIPLMGLQLLYGRNFEQGMQSNGDEIIVTERAVRQFGFASNEEALGAEIVTTRYNRPPHKIIGIVKDFYLRSPKEALVPLFLVYSEYARYITVRLKPGDVQAAVANVTSGWNKVFPGTLFEYFFLDEKYDQQYVADTRFAKVISSFSVLAVLIACLGLFGLSSYTILQRTKEIGIRKVLGASVFQIVNLLSFDFLKVLFIATMIAVPIAYCALQTWLSEYAIRINLTPWIFIVPIASIFAVALATVSIQTTKTAVTNPINSLKQE